MEHAADGEKLLLLALCPDFGACEFDARAVHIRFWLAISVGHSIESTFERLNFVAGIGSPVQGPLLRSGK